MIKEKVKQIENNIREVLNESEDFLDLDEKFKSVLRELKENSNKLRSNKTELLNILLKYSKRKMLFDFELKGIGKYDRDKKLKVGLNENGLGLLNGEWEHNLRNIENYYAKDTFKDLCKNEDFIKEFSKHINKHLKGKHQRIMKKLIYQEKIEEVKIISIGDINLVIKLNDNYNSLEYQNKSARIIQILKKEKPTEPLDFDFSLDSFREFCNLLEHKPKIISTLRTELKNCHKLNDKTKIKLAEVDKELLPYKALEKI